MRDGGGLDQKRSESGKEKTRESSPARSDSTEDLPDRFDKDGYWIPERGTDAMADELQDIWAGKGRIGRFFDKIIGASENEMEGGGRSDGRRRRRSR